MKIHEIMSSDILFVSPEATLVEAAGLMRELDVGAVPVCDHDRLTGMLTDRDLALRAVAKGMDPKITAVREMMSREIDTIFDDQTVEEAAQLMEQKQLGSLPVLDRNKRLVGIVSLGDVTLHAQPAVSGNAIEESGTRDWDW